MRGKDDPPPDSKGDWGITPAYAGKSSATLIIIAEG